MTAIKLYFYSLFPPSPSEEQMAVLEKHSSYYRHLSEMEKKRFSRRVRIFLLQIKFFATSGYKVNEQMKTIIASAAIQLTFGLKRFIFRYYNKIYIEADQYYIPEMKEALLGHVDKKKRSITLSWPSVEKGFAIPDDAHNVVLHELSHVILFENSLRFQHQEFFSRLQWDSWLWEAESKFYSMQKKRSHVLREYAKNNLQEMFAVSIETFFEQSAKFKRHLPTLYQALSDLLNQDPTNIEDPVGSKKRL